MKELHRKRGGERRKEEGTSRGSRAFICYQLPEIRPLFIGHAISYFNLGTVVVANQTEMLSSFNAGFDSLLEVSD